MKYEKASAQLYVEMEFGLRPSRLILFWALKGACCTLSFQTHPLSLTLQVSLDLGT
ncbi:Protein Xni [Gossypium arboreum]|uniref:Protein Xni n=1 Tax=Gossypium arboreum TaxID=29729 RepID=A0A0B0MII9_GOSAR|nr:Protein Xni [Gossypium arboreum]KHG00192.1 Protein Xni [Gossypium arboreum]